MVTEAGGTFGACTLENPLSMGKISSFTCIYIFSSCAIKFGLKAGLTQNFSLKGQNLFPVSRVKPCIEVDFNTLYIRVCRSPAIQDFESPTR